MSLEIDEAFKDQRTRYFVNDKSLSRAILFNPSDDEIRDELKRGSREVSASEWDAFKTKSMRK